MSFDHKAFLLEYNQFEFQLSGILMDSLITGDVSQLVAFIIQNLAELKDPDEGEPLDDFWEEKIETKDAHQYGDFALTKFYCPQNDIGLSYDWNKMQNCLYKEFTEQPSILLGVPFGSENNLFDPGKMGSYFQSPYQVIKNLRTIENFVLQKPELAIDLSSTVNMLRMAARERKGLYITF